MNSLMKDYYNKIIQGKKNANVLVNISYQQQFEICENNRTIFGENEKSISDFILYIKSNPSILNEIEPFIFASDKELNSLAYFFNFFLYDLFDSDYMNGYLQFIYKLLEEEVDGLDSVDSVDSFLKRSFGKFLFQNLLPRKEILEYLKEIFSDIINYILINQIELPSKVNLDNIYNITLEERNIGGRESIEVENELSNPILKNINEAVLKDEINKSNDEEIKKYYEIQINNYPKGKAYYGNSDFLYMLYSYDNPKELMQKYWNYYQNMKLLISMLFQKLNDTKIKIPYIIRSISKIIMIILKNKFPDIKQVYIYAYISKFFFSLIVESLIEDKMYLSSISSEPVLPFIKVTLLNLHSIVKQITSGMLYTNKNSYYTPFNWYIFELIPNVFKFFKYLINIPVPEFFYKAKVFPNDNISIIQAKDDEEEIEIEVSFPKYHEQKLFRAICFSTSNLVKVLSFVSTIKEIKESKPLENKEFQNFLNRYNEIKNNNEFIEDLNQRELEEKGTDHHTYYIVTDNYFDFMQKKRAFLLPSHNKKEDNTIIKKSKDLLIQILKGLKQIVIKDFIELKIESFIDFISQLEYLIKANISLENQVMILSSKKELLSIINLLPKEYQDHDYNLLLIETNKEINQNISLYELSMVGSLSIENISLRDKIEDVNKENYFSIKYILKAYLSDIFFTLKVPVLFNYCSDGTIQIEKKEEDKKYFFRKSLKKGTNCENIRDFIKAFPDLNKLTTLKGREYFRYMKTSQIPNSLEIYFNEVEETLKKLESFSQFKWDEQANIIQQTKNLLLLLIYDKIFPTKLDEDDSAFYLNCKKLSWLEPENVFEEKDLIYAPYFKQISDLFNVIDNTKNLDIMMDSFYSILRKVDQINALSQKSIEFSKLLVYTAIKASPHQIFSKIEMLSTFAIWDIDGKAKVFNDYLSNIYTDIIKLNHMNLFNVSREEFNK